MELSKGVDVFVTEIQPDTGNLQALKFGMPSIMATNTIDQAHSPHYAVGYMFNKIQPRLAMVTHISFDEELVPEMIAGVRVHYSGLFQFGASDVVVVNVTKDAVWTRKAAIPESGNMTRPSPRDAAGLFDLSPTNLEVRFPNPRHTVADMMEQEVRDREIDPKKYLIGLLIAEVTGEPVREAGEAVSDDAVRAPGEAFSTVSPSAGPESDGRAA